MQRFRFQSGLGHLACPLRLDLSRSTIGPILLLGAALHLAGQVAPAQNQRSIDRTALIPTNQQRFVADLTGHQLLAGKGIGPRSTAAERARAVQFLADSIERHGRAAVRHEYRMAHPNGLVNLLLPPYRGTNLFTVIPSTADSTEHVIVGAHYDTVPDSPGAIDNASGVALVYALAQTLSQLPDRPLNFMLVFFDQEEDDEVGSRAFAQYLDGSSLPVHSVHIADLVGWNGNLDCAVEIQSPGPFLEEQYRAAAATLEIPLSVTQGASSDNKSFLQAGYRTVGVWDPDYSPHVHKSTDTYETLNFDCIQSTTGLVFEVLRRF